MLLSRLTVVESELCALLTRQKKKGKEKKKKENNREGAAAVPCACTNMEGMRKQIVRTFREKMAVCVLQKAPTTDFC